ncbi:MAG: FAD:protein FMN transferase [Proteobacteria bacterium]|nr:MAG: FAD:protein FMN transferase [Pseudomonadota bacterium]
MNLFEIGLEQRLMNTNFCFTLAVPEAHLAAAELILEEALSVCANLEEELSEFRATSPVARLNAARAGTAVLAPPSFRELWRLAENLNEASEGAFNPLCKSREPGSLSFDSEGYAQKSHDGVAVSFGAIGKGYALDCVAKMLEHAGFTNFLLNAGGSSLVLSGSDADLRPWAWGWSWEKNAAGFAGAKFSHGGQKIALGISGSEEQGAHILGVKPVAGESPVRSALVGHPSAAHADALSTALFVKGWSSFSALPAALKLLPASAVITLENKVHWNGGFQNLWGPAC